jgi:hypothetical protein
MGVKSQIKCSTVDPDSRGMADAFPSEGAAGKQRRDVSETLEP